MDILKPEFLPSLGNEILKSLLPLLEPGIDIDGLIFPAKFIVAAFAGDGALERLEKLGVEEVHMKVKDKKVLLEQLSMSEGVPLENMLYMGDDMPDFEAMEIVGIAACPADACFDIKNISSYKALAKGGEGCAREVIEKVLKLNGHWDLVDHVQAK